MQIDYYGHPGIRIGNKDLSLDVLATAGPRIVGLRLANSDENLLKELPDTHWDTPNGEYHVYGGHRLWYGPEEPERTYIPDDQGVTITETATGADLIGACEAQTGIRKIISVAFVDNSPALTVTHQLVNEGTRSWHLAPWAITQLPLGGKVILPQTIGAFPADRPGANFQPNRNLVLWNYTHWDDTRIEIHDDHLLIHGKPIMPPCKIGLLDTLGWAAYLRNDILFIKRFSAPSSLDYPDRGSNVEVYCNDTVLELETLGPLVTIAPRQTVTHTEFWELVPGVRTDASFEQVAHTLRSQQSDRSISAIS